MSWKQFTTTINVGMGGQIYAPDPNIVVPYMTNGWINFDDYAAISVDCEQSGAAGASSPKLMLQAVNDVASPGSTLRPSTYEMPQLNGLSLTNINVSAILLNFPGNIMIFTRDLRAKWVRPAIVNGGGPPAPWVATLRIYMSDK